MSLANNANSASSSPALPLDRLTLRVPTDGVDGVQQDLPALHPHWKQTRDWAPFRPPPKATDDNHNGAGEARLAEWAERADFVSQDLSFLLNMEYHRFWSQLVHDASLHAHLEHLLQTLPRPHDLEPSPDPAVRRQLDSIGRQLFLVFLRLSTCHESVRCHITPARFADLVYDNYLFDLPSLLDLCVLFGADNGPLLQKMIQNVFKHQPAYADDLHQAVEVIAQALVVVTGRVDVMTGYSNCVSGQHVDELKDLVSYIADITVSLDAFLQAYPLGASAFTSAEFPLKLAAFYQSSVVALSKYIQRQTQSGFLDESLCAVLISRLQLARLSSVSILRQLLHNCYMKAVFEQSSHELEETAEEFLQLLTNCLSENTLVVDYDMRHPLKDDFDLFEQAGVSLDAMRVEYVVGGVRQLRDELDETLSKAESRKWTRTQGPAPTATEPTKAAQSAQEDGGAGADPDLVAMNSLISQVRDLMPDLGDGFVEACLRYYDFNAEKVINAMFEENLPPHLADLDRQTPRKAPPAKPEPVLDASEPAGSLLEAASKVAGRSSVYDGDEFDVNAHSGIDKSKIHRGKRSKVKSTNALLEDKSHLAGMKDRYAALGIVTDELEDLEYDDEYDDTYDDNIVGQAEPDAKDELLERRPFVLPRALGGGHVGRVVQEDDDEEEDEEEGARKKDHFVRNPAEVREEAERRRREMQAQRGGRRRGGGRGGGAGAGGGAPQQPKDLVGKPKGQGQDKQVLINRSRKTTNKGKRHQAGADRKQAKGMF